MEGLDPTALDQLQNHPWPGTVRELEHVIERAVLMARGSVIRSADLGLRAAIENAPRLEEMSLEEVEAHLIRKTLTRFEGNAQKAAEALGLSRSAFYRRVERYKL
jgi:DNA-binding NtrC family response regulator